MPEALPHLTFDSSSVDALAADVEFWQLYESAFPSCEREPRSVILDSLRKGLGFVLRANAGGRTVGLACVHLLRERPVPFLVYLAVAVEVRSRHIGAALFQDVWARAQDRYSEWGLSPKGIVWEVDIPERASSEQELQQSRRRVAFFARLGGHIMPGHYVQPPVDGIAPVPMHLMFWPAPGLPLPDDSDLSGLIRAIYFEKYHAANGIPRAVLEGLLQEQK
jgi:hypothetical protein